MPAFFNTLDFPPLPIPATSPCFSAASVMFWLIKLFVIKSIMYQLNLIWEMHSHFIISELQIVCRCLCICEWINTCLEEALLQIVIGLFPSICIRAGYQSVHGDEFQPCFTSPCWDTHSVNQGQLRGEVRLTDLCCYHCNVVPQQCFSVKKFRCKNRTIPRIYVEYSVHICVSINRIPKKAE